MRTTSFIIFFSIFFSIYGLVNFYIYMRGLQALPRDGNLRYWYTGLFLVISLSYIAGRFLERLTVCAASDALIWIGSFWLAYMLYFFMAVFFLDIARGANNLLGFFPAAVTGNYAKAKLVAFFYVVAAVTVVVIAGHINTLYPKITRLDITVDRETRGPRTLDLVVATDIHLGVLISNSRLKTLVDGINALSPDAVLLAGDIVDEDIAPVIEKNLGELLRSLRAKHGVFAVTGNHEYIGGADAAVKYLEEHGVTFIRDSAVLVDGSYYIAGREDRSASQFNGRVRKRIGEVLEGVDRRYPLILMDHQPFGLAQTAEHGVDLQVSGHTHNGQLWPINFITRKIYEISRGHGRIGAAHFYVSSGYGTWGPPVRTVNRPEIVHIRISFKNAMKTGGTR